MEGSGKSMKKSFHRDFSILAIFIWVSFPFSSQAITRLGPATVQVELLPVYSDVSVMSGIVMFLRKGNVVEIQSVTLTPDSHWCSVIESGQTTPLGYVNCEALVYPRGVEPDLAKEEKDLSMVRETPSSGHSLPSGAPIKTESSPSFGEFLMALWKEDLATVKDLLEKGANPNGQTGDGTKPLLIAAKKRNPDLIRMLIENGAEVNGRDRNGMTALMAASTMGLSQNVQVFMEAGADVNAKDHRGNTALIWAALHGYPPVVEILLANGADVNSKTNQGLTAWRVSKRIIAELKRSLADVQKTDDESALSKIKGDLARHEGVLQLLEEVAGEKDG
jgi:hypothetical protein